MPVEPKDLPAAHSRSEGHQESSVQAVLHSQRKESRRLLGVPNLGRPAGGAWSMDRLEGAPGELPHVYSVMEGRAKDLCGYA